MRTSNITIAGHTINRPIEILTDYSQRYAGTLTKYDFRDKGDPNALTAEEIWATRIIHSRITRSEQSELEKRSRSWRADCGSRAYRPPRRRGPGQ